MGSQFNSGHIGNGRIAVTILSSFWLSIVITGAALCCSIAGAQQTIPPDIKPYTTCRFDDGLEVSDLAPLALSVTTRSVRTLRGMRQIEMTAGERVMFSYPNTDFYANVKVEQLPDKSYLQEKQDLIGEFDYLLSSGNDQERNYALKPKVNGFEIYGLDRTKLEGGVLGLYLFFDDSARMVTTIYLLNQEPSQRKFQTIDEYRKLRDHFLAGFTSCIRQSQTKPSR